MSDVQTPRQAAAPATTETTEQPVDAWGYPISAERQAELQGYLDRWQAETDHGGRKSPYDGVSLSGADVYWLAQQSVGMLNYYGEAPNLLLGGALITRARLAGAGLRFARLEGVNLAFADLEGANLSAADLEGANLGEATLTRADLSAADLRRARLHGAHLEGANLSYAHVEGADLIETSFDADTVLARADLLEEEDRRALLARLLRRPRYGPALGDIHWGAFDQVQLTQVKGWNALRRLADESRNIYPNYPYDSRAERAYRQVAQRLRDQGYSDVADHLNDRAQVLHRKNLFILIVDDWRRPWRLPGDLVRWLFSWFLALLAGYGYHPGRSVFWYLATIAGFAYAYLKATAGWIPFGLPHPSSFAPLTWYEALILSVSSFHGRGFFQPVQSLGDPIAALAAIEAVIGLLIEISFIATFTQRFFGSK